MASFPLAALYMEVTAQPKARRISFSRDSDLTLQTGGSSSLLGWSKTEGGIDDDEFPRLLRNHGFMIKNHFRSVLRKGLHCYSSKREERWQKKVTETERNQVNIHTSGGCSGSCSGAAAGLISSVVID